MRIIVVGVFAQSLLAWRGPMLAAMASKGHDVLAMAPEDEPHEEKALNAMGVQYATVRFSALGWTR